MAQDRTFWRVLGLFLALLFVGCDSERPVASRAVGAPCSDHNACQSGFCLGNLPGGYCSLRCEQGGACPAGSLCTPRGEVSFCLDACETAAGCREGYACREGRCDPSCDEDEQCRLGEACDPGLGCVPAQ